MLTLPVVNDTVSSHNQNTHQRIVTSTTDEVVAGGREDATGEGGCGDGAGGGGENGEQTTNTSCIIAAATPEHSIRNWLSEFLRSDRSHREWRAGRFRKYHTRGLVKP